MNAKIRFPHCKQLPIISPKAYHSFQQKNILMSKEKIRNDLNGTELRQSILGLINGQCDNSENIFVTHLIGLHQEVDNLNNEKNNVCINNNNNDIEENISFVGTCNDSCCTNTEYNAFHNQQYFNFEAYRYSPY